MRDNSGDATFDVGIAACFGLESSAPYAALRLLGEELAGVTPGEHHWTCADPVHLRFHQERLILADGDAGGSGVFTIANRSPIIVPWQDNRSRTMLITPCAGVYGRYSTAIASAVFSHSKLAAKS